jgi:hypothetical protein
MSAETKRILEMLAEGKIAAGDAEKLLDKLNSSSSDVSTKEKAADAGGAPKQPRVMRIVVERPGHEAVNIRMPLAFTRTGSRLMAVLPLGVTEKLSDLGIDVATLGEMTSSIEDMHIDVDKGNGKRVRIFCE